MPGPIGDQGESGDFGIKGAPGTTGLPGVKGERVGVLEIIFPCVLYLNLSFRLFSIYENVNNGSPQIIT